MTDPLNALQSFQQVFLTGGMELQPGALDSDLYLNLDDADGVTRFTYVKLQGKTVTAFVIFGACAPIEGRPCFAIGYAVPEAYRNQGRAKEAVRAALAEMQRSAGVSTASQGLYHTCAVLLKHSTLSGSILSQ
jgi:hypothetical protein